jgi:hypothetical protein
VKRSITIGLMALAIVVGAFLAIPTVNAQTTTMTESLRCSVSQTRLTSKIERLEAAKASSNSVYGAITGKVDGFISSAQTSGYDVADMTAARDTVNAQLQLFVQKVEIYSNALASANDASCGSSDGEYVTALAAARQALAETRLAADGVRASVRSEVIPALQTYAAWLKDQAAMPPAEEESDESN